MNPISSLPESFWTIRYSSRLEIPTICNYRQKMTELATFNIDNETVCIEKEDLVKGVVKYPIGYKQYLMEYCALCPRKCPIVDERIKSVQLEKCIGEPLKVELRSGQVNAVKAIVNAGRENGNGLIVMPTGSGKTLLTLKIANMSKLNNLFIVPRLDLAYQMQYNAKKYFGVDVGMIGDGKYEMKPWTVAVIDTLHRRKKFDEISNFFSMTHWDEVHTILTKKWYETFINIKSYYKIGYTATLNKKNNSGIVINRMFGGVLYQLSVQEALQQKDIVPLVVQNVYTEYRASFEYDFRNPWKNAEKYKMLIKDVELDDHRCRVIVNAIDLAHSQGSRIVVVLNSREQCEKVLQGLHRIQSKAKSIIYMSDLNSNARASVKRSIQTRELDVLLTVKLAGLGLDIPELDTMVFDQKISDKLNIEQYVGRVVRSCSETNKKMSRVIHVRDPYVPMFEKQYISALEVYNKFSLQNSLLEV